MKPFAFGLVLLLANSVANAAQNLSGADATAIEVAAANWVRARLPKGEPIGLDRAAFSHGDRKPATRAADRINSLAEVLSAKEVEEKTVYRCANRSPKSCELDVAVLVRIGKPIATGDSARIEVQQRYRWQPAPGSPMSPVGFATQELILLKQGRVWRVVKLGPGSTS